MNYRKIIEFGKSSYVISLPKNWLLQKKIGKGDLVYLEEDNDKIIIFPKQSEKISEFKSITLDVTKMSEEEIHTRLISAYVKNYNEIIFKSKDLKLKAKQIRDMVHDLMALEIMEETATKIIAKDFINMKEISPQHLLKKMDVITREILSDSKSSFKEDKCVNLSERDGDVNRLSHLLSRTLHFIMENPIYSKNAKLNHQNMVSLWDISDYVEQVADQSKRIAKLMTRMNLSNEEKKQFIKIYTSVEHYYVKAMDIYYSKNSERAIKEILNAKPLLKQCRDFYRENSEVDWVAVTIEEIKNIIGMTKMILVSVSDVLSSTDE